MASDPIRVLLVDDHLVARSGVRLMLSGEADIRLVAEAANYQEARQQLQCQPFDVVLLDIGLPGRSGLELLQVIRACPAAPAVLCLSGYAEELYALRALREGAAGYLTKDCAPALLAAAVRKAAGGGRYLSAALAERLAARWSGAGARGHAALSDRELDVLRLIAAGTSLVQIATALHLSPHTITTYRSRILHKLALSSNAELARYALECGLFP